MGFTGELVRRVFSRNRSTASYESKGRKNSTENQRWGSVRSYFEEAAAIRIQSAYRSFLLRSPKDEIRCNNGEVHLNL
ncbi:hypothetical protein HN873_067696, partial [Arachis hypogaea]